MANWAGDVMRAFLALLVCGMAFAAPAPKKSIAPKPFNKAAFEDYVRHLFVWPTTIHMDIADPKPGPMPGYDEVDVRASQGKASQEEVFYVSKDGKKVVRGTVFDLDKNPFQEDLNKLRTEFRPSLGTAGASVVIVEFSDFECHFCKDEAKAIRENLIKTYPKDVRLYFMDFPLETLHPWAKSAALMGQAIFKLKPDAFWEYHDWIFEHQAEITTENLENKVFDFAREKGIDVLLLKSAITSKPVEEAVEKSLAMGNALKLQSTPTLFVNGRKMVGAVDFNELKRIIDFEIEYQKTAKNAGEDCGCEVKLAFPGVK